MATTPRDSLRRIVAGRKSIFMSARNVIDDTVSFNQGDLIAFDTSAKLLKAVALAGDTANILGVAPVTVVDGVIPGPYAGLATAQAIGDVPGPIYGDIHLMNLKNGDTFHPGDKVYAAYSVDAQTVTTSSDGYPVGIFQDAQITAASGSTGEVLIGCLYALGNPVL